MAEITKDEYDTWKQATFDDPYMIWHDGLPTDNVTGLTGDVRAQTVRMLIFGVQTLDGHAASALAAMNEASALPHLRTALEQVDSYARVDIAEAIHSLSRSKEDSNSMAKELISVLEQEDLHWGVKINAAMGLRRFKDQASEDALLAAIGRKEDFLVKNHACESLLWRWSVIPADISSHGAIFSVIGDAQEGDAIQDEDERCKEALRLMRQLKP